MLIRTLLFCSLLLIPTGTVFAAENSIPSVIVSIPPQQYIVERIAKDAFAVTVLVSPGADPHSFEPSPSQVREISKAHVWLTIGVPFEDSWASRISGTTSNLSLISMTDGLKHLSYRSEEIQPSTTSRITDWTLITQSASNGGAASDLHDEHNLSVIVPGISRDHDHGAKVDATHIHSHKNDHHQHIGADPHVWLSPLYVKAMLPSVTTTLSELMPERAQEFIANADAFADELSALDQTIVKQLSIVPLEKRYIISSHSSWRYFAASYGFQERSMESDGKKPSPKALQSILDFAKQTGTHTIFAEPQFSTDYIKALAEAIPARIVEINPLDKNILETYKTMVTALLLDMQTTNNSGQ